MYRMLLPLERYIKPNKFTLFLTRLGEASYVMYLIHLHVIMLVSRIVFNRIFGVNTTFTLELIKIMIAFAVTIISSIFIFHVPGLNHRL